MSDKKSRKFDVNNHEFDDDFSSSVVDGPLDIDFSNFSEEAFNKQDDHEVFNPLKTFSQTCEIDISRLEKQGFLTPNQPTGILSSSFRMIKRPLLMNMSGKGASQVDRANLVMVTSSVPGEGKTFTAINLAISLAMEKDKRVLLIDADVNKPSHYQIFNIENKAGLTDLLLGEVRDMGDVLYKTNLGTLSIMSSGRLYEYSTELLASESMEAFIEDISARYKDRIVIFDSPPLLHTTEASVLASHMGQVVVVAEAENTLKPLIKKSINLLSNEIVLMLLNKQREKTDSEHYGYYGYGHKQQEK